MSKITDEAEDNEYAKRRTKYFRLLSIEQRLETLGISLDELIELINARNKKEF